jgi:hypothetical protein
VLQEGRGVVSRLFDSQEKERQQWEPTDFVLHIIRVAERHYTPFPLPPAPPTAQDMKEAVQSRLFDSQEKERQQWEPTDFRRSIFSFQSGTFSCKSSILPLAIVFAIMPARYWTMLVSFGFGFAFFGQPLIGVVSRLFDSQEKERQQWEPTDFRRSIFSFQSGTQRTRKSSFTSSASPNVTTRRSRCRPHRRLRRTW